MEGTLILHLINNQPFIDFDDRGIDFDRLFYEATEFMIRNPVYTPAPMMRFADDPANLLRDTEVKLTDHDRKRMAGYSKLEKLYYLKFVKRVYYVWHIYNLNEDMKWKDRQKPRADFFPNTKKHMPYFVEVIKGLKIFQSIGWSRIYGNDAYSAVHLHWDYSDTINQDQFIYFNLNGKGLFLHDHDTKERTYLTKKSAYFDANNWHGTDPEPFFNFSMRIDGVFTKQFRETLTYSRLNEK